MNSSDGYRIKHDLHHIKVLLIEDNKADARWTEELLKHVEYASNSSLNHLLINAKIQLEWKNTFSAGLAALAADMFDIVLLDLTLPDAVKLEGVQALTEKYPEIPVVVLSGLDDESVALNAVHAGAEDFLIKGRVDAHLLRRALCYSIERHFIRRELAEAKEEAFQAAQAKSEFLARMSHEIRTPLTPIVSYAELMIAKKLGAAEQEKALMTILHSVLHLQRIVDEVLDFSKIEAQQFEIDSIHCSVLSIVEEVKSVLSPKAELKRIDLNFEYIAPLPRSIVTDPTRLKQILFNIVGNAIKFTAEGGVTVTVSCIEESEEIIVEVVDTGIGISQEQAQKLFKPFSQVDGSITRQFGGTGLGLHISKVLVEKLGGELFFESAPGRGSVFTFTINTGPLDEVEMLKIIEDLDSISCKFEMTEPPKLNGRVLLAEDGIDNKEVISFLVRSTGLEVVTVENGEEAVQEASKNDFSLILMDMHMPKMDGISATKLIRADGNKVPIVALTANRNSEAIELCRLAGCDDYLAKPFKSELLFQMLERNLKHT